MCAIGYIFWTSPGRTSGQTVQRYAAAVPVAAPRRPMLIFVSLKKSTWRSNMPTINLKDFYPWYTTDEYIEVSTEVAAELFADKRYEKSYRRRVYYNKAQYSLDAGDAIENAAIPSGLTMDAILEYGLTICELCRALNSLPDVQGRRVRHDLPKRLFNRWRYEREHHPAAGRVWQARPATSLCRGSTLAVYTHRLAGVYCMRAGCCRPSGYIPAGAPRR